MNNHCRIILKDNNHEIIEVYFSKKLSFKENLELISHYHQFTNPIIFRNLDKNLIDIDILIEKFNFIDGELFYVIDNT